MENYWRNYQPTTHMGCYPNFTIITRKFLSKPIKLTRYFVSKEGDVDSKAAKLVVGLFKSLQVLSNVVLSMESMEIK